MGDPLTAEFIADEYSIEKPRALTAPQRRKALTWCLNNDWKGVDIDTMERIDDDVAGLYGWAMWERA